MWVSRYIGGGYMETFAYDSKLSEKEHSREGRLAVRLESTLNRFTLSDMVGISSASP